MNIHARTLAALTLAGGTGCLLTACSNTTSGSTTRTESVVETAKPARTEGLIHARTAADTEYLRSREPITADRLTLYVDGMGCPLCVTNVDKQLLRLKGVKNVQVDLGAGTVEVALAGPDRPTPHRLSEAVTDAGNTLARIALR
ncbi:MAG: heavy-metal-associated domain-containing protein [Phycisphaerales bacterium]